MPSELIYPHVVKRPDESAHLERYPRTRVAMLVGDYVWRGWSAEEIARQYPYLTLAEIHAALAYYFDHREEIDEELISEYRAVEEWKQAHPTSSILLRLKQPARS
jgi:uncharacterized protein (DUF433 family)